MDKCYFSKQITKQTLCSSKLDTNIRKPISWQLQLAKESFFFVLCSNIGLKETSVSEHILRIGYTLSSDTLRTK